jgi:hypothetical protein
VTDDTPALTINALTVIGHKLGFMSEEWADVSLGGEIPAAALTELREMWGLLLGEGEYIAADWFAATINTRGSGEPAERFDRLADGLGPLAADGGHLTFICEDGPWTAICESCADYTPGVFHGELILGRDYPTVAAAEEAAARHIAEADALRST